MKVKVEVIENDTGKAIARPVLWDDVPLEDVMPMVDETWSVTSTPVTGWLVVSKPHYRIRKREWNFGGKFGLHCIITTCITETEVE